MINANINPVIPFHRPDGTLEVPSFAWVNPKAKFSESVVHRMLTRICDADIYIKGTNSACGMIPAHMRNVVTVEQMEEAFTMPCPDDDALHTCSEW